MEFRQNNGEGIPKAFLCVENWIFRQQISILFQEDIQNRLLFETMIDFLQG